jgi:hypothetical protein
MSSTSQRDIDTVTTMLRLVESPEIRRRLETALQDSGDEPVVTDRVLSAEQAGKILGRSDRWVLKASKEGLLKRVRYPGRKIAGGFVESDVRALLARSIEGGP